MSVQASQPPGAPAEAVLYDLDVFDGLDLNQGGSFLDVHGDEHRVESMLTAERLSALGELEAMASAVPGGVSLVRRSRLYTALLAIPAPDHG